MDKVFLDTNVILDYLAARVPFDGNAKALFLRGERGEIELFASTLSFCNISYILPRLDSTVNLIQILTDLSALLTLAPVDAFTISAALQSDFTDFEDAVQHFSAEQAGGISHFITRNPADFQHSSLPVFTPEKYLAGNS